MFMHLQHPRNLLYTNFFRSLFGPRQFVSLFTLLCCFFAVFSSTLTFAKESPLSDAQKAYDDVNFEECLAKSALALHAKASLEERILGFRLRGLCAGAVGDDELAAEMFSMMLALDSSASLEKGVSPRIGSAFLEAKGAWLDDNALDLEVVSDSTDDDIRVLTLTITDLTDQVHEVVAVDNQGIAQPAVRSSARMEIEVPAYLSALLLVDEFGGVLFRRSLNENPPQEGQAIPVVKGANPIAVNDDEADYLPLFMGISAGAGTVVLIGASVALASWILLSPSTVSLSSGISYAPQP